MPVQKLMSIPVLDRAGSSGMEVPVDNLSARIFYFSHLHCISGGFGRVGVNQSHQG